MKKKILVIAMSGLLVLSMVGCGLESSRKPTSREIESGGEISKHKDVEIFKGKAKGKDFFTGTYKDEKLNATIKIVADIESGTAVMSFKGIGGLSEDDSEEVATKDNVIYTDGYSSVSGKYCTVIWTDKEDKDYMQFSSGEGEAWGDFKKVSKKAIIKIEGGSYDENQEEEREKAKEENVSNASTYMDTLKGIADASVKDREILLTEVKQAGGGDEIYKVIVDDRSEYHSDIIYGNWWVDNQINGIPIAFYLPDSLGSRLNSAGLTTYAGYQCRTGKTLNDLKLIDQETCTVESIKRTDPDAWGTYAFYIQNCQKNIDNNGKRYLAGYIGTDYVAVYGDFDKIFNGDNVFMYADYVDLSIEDVPIFLGAYAEIIP